MAGEKLTAQAWEVVRSTLLREDVDGATRSNAAAHEIVKALVGAGLIADRDDLLAMIHLAKEQLKRFTESGHPGAPCKRTAWIDVATIDEEWKIVHDVQARLR